MNANRSVLWMGACLIAGMAVTGRAADTPPDAARDVLKTGTFSIAIEQGSIKSIIDLKSAKDYLPGGKACPVLSVQVDGKLVAPTSLEWLQPGQRFKLSYGTSGVTAELAVAAKPTHLVFELLSVAPKEKVEMVLWGPFASTANQNAGPMTGLLWNQDFALGLQVLNPKTVSPVAGQPENVLAASCRNYERPTPATAYGYTFTVSYPGDGVAGSKIALFGCPSDQVLDTISAIELAEKLPHVTWNGKWVKALPGNPYLAFEFSEETIDDFIKVALDSGISFIFHPSPWQSWGHFEPKKAQFPNGRAGFKACVDKAHKAGLRIGTHTLGTFITADDAYVTPKPDPRLASAGGSKLSKEWNEKDTVLEVADGAAFSAPGQKKCLRIGEELLTYNSVAGDKPARLEGCTRGAFGTQPQAHAAGTEAVRLIVTDFFGTIFLGNRELNREIAQRGAKNCVEFGLDKYEFDGVEGTASCGLEYGYSTAEFAQTWYDALGAKSGKVMLGGSGLTNYLNHIMDCVNWGEPWGDVFRRGMIDYRFMRMEQYKRNLLPHMLGQFSASVYATAGTSQPGQEKCRVDDIEWLMALRCGHDSGFSLTFTPDWEAYLRGKQASPVAALKLPNIAAITTAMHAWETAYQAKAFPPDVKTLLQDRKREFHLVENGPKAWTLYPIQASPAAALDAKTRQARAENPYDGAPLTFVILNGPAPVSNLSLKLPDNVIVPLTGVELAAGEILHYTGGDQVAILTANWGQRATVKIDPNKMKAAKGPVEVGLDWTGANETKVQLELRFVGPAWQLTPGK